ncbi:MAG: site-specific DNA-methyltransferase, partial [Alphaproteobacteria bacterium]|nr:site-specific DNA-methyltransferase [Alphaproteobacteria bacterium]
LVVARPRTVEFSRWGTLPGLYTRAPGDPRSEWLGGKPLGVMREIVRDYSRPGDTILDTFCGSGTTLLAALLEGRRAIGCDRLLAAIGATRERCEPWLERASALVGVEPGRTLEMFSR